MSQSTLIQPPTVDRYTSPYFTSLPYLFGHLHPIPDKVLDEIETFTTSALIRGIHDGTSWTVAFAFTIALNNLEMLTEESRRMGASVLYL